MAKENKWAIANFESFMIAFPLVLLLIVGNYQRYHDHYQILDYENHKNMRMLYGLTLGCAVILLMPMLMGSRDFVIRIFFWVVFSIIPCIALIWYGLMYFNCSQDKSNSETISAKILMKEQQSNRGFTSYMLVMRNQSYDARALRVSVSKDFFLGVKKEDHIDLNIKGGYLGFKWLESYKKSEE